MTELFSIARLPRIEFGAGSVKKLPGILARYGKRVLLVTGGHSFLGSPQWEWLSAALREQGFTWEIFRVTGGEPSPKLVDEAVAVLRGGQFDVVLGIGGGSVLDAAKAIAGLLKPGNSVMDHLEGVGPELPYRGPATPFVAVPTTAGTGSEATKNAVLSVHGRDGFKKSFRDEQLVPEYAVVDPDLLASCPPHLIAANGMDAFTQLLESFVSSKANPFTDALAWSGMEAVRDGLPAWYDNGGFPHPSPLPRGAPARSVPAGIGGNAAQSGEKGDEVPLRGIRLTAPAGREKMAYAALLSGITLAQVGLGSVHGLAAPLGAFFPIPHGVACGTLLAAATRVNIEVMEARDANNPALQKYARVGRLLHGMKHMDDIAARGALLQSLEAWTERMGLPRLGEFGVGVADLPHIISNCRGSSMKTNPVVLSDAQVGEVLRARL